MTKSRTTTYDAMRNPNPEKITEHYGTYLVPWNQKEK